MSRMRPAEPGATFLRGLRRALTLWYSAVLVATLGASDLVLYLALQDQLLRPVREQLDASADFSAHRWRESPAEACAPPIFSRTGLTRRSPGAPPPPPRLPGRPAMYIACMDPAGRVLGAMSIPGGESDPLPRAFLDRPLLAEALTKGRVSDIADSGEEAGPILRVAVAVSGPGAGGVLGVVQVGCSIAQQTSTLRLLRDLLLALGALAVLVATVGGLLLARRALAPAHFALARQQAFIADASHELRTPLTLIRANAEVLLRQRDRLNPDDAALVQDIVAETEHMDRLTTDLLTLARLDAGALHLEREPVDLSEVAADAARRIASLARERGIAVQEEYAAGAHLQGDRKTLEQAALILLENAVKYTRSGGTITLRTAAGDGQVSLVVEDTGIGIAPEHLSRLGDRFYRVDAARTRDEGGAGLGLAIAFGIAAAHGGTVQITSTPGQGTRATLRLATRKDPAGGPQGGQTA